MAKNIFLPATTNNRSVERALPAGWNTLSFAPTRSVWINEKRKRQLDAYNAVVISETTVLHSLAEQQRAIARIQAIDSEIELDKERLGYQLDMIREKRMEIARRSRGGNAIASSQGGGEETLDLGIIEEVDDE